VLLLLAGNFMEPNSIILIMAPILAPAAKKLGIDLVHFGIVMDVNMEVGLCHPPVGLNLYVASMIARMRITELAVAVLPWLITMLGFLVIVTYWPDLTLWLPRVLGCISEGGEFGARSPPVGAPVLPPPMMAIEREMRLDAARQAGGNRND